MALMVWSVFCIGLALVVMGALASGEDAYAKTTSAVSGIGVGYLLWSIGLGVWALVGLFV